MKYCSNCRQEKPLSDFGKNKSKPDGLTQWCKLCRNQYRQQWRLNNLEHAKKTERENKRAERKRKGKEYFREYDRKWYQKNKEHKKKYVADRRQNDKHKIKAQNKLNKVVQSGKIIRPDICPSCGEKTKVDGHHYDYNKPYDVFWLCRSCHMIDHSDYYD